MAFHFTLEAVRRLRQSLEDRERMCLEHLLARRAALLHQLDQAQAAGLDLQQRLQRVLLAGPTPAAQIHFAVVCREAIASRQKLLQRQLPQLEGEIAEQMVRFRKERQEREVLDSLRDSQWRVYHTLQQRREQAQLDEMHLLGRGRKGWT